MRRKGNCGKFVKTICLYHTFLQFLRHMLIHANLISAFYNFPPFHNRLYKKTQTTAHQPTNESLRKVKC